MTQSENIQEKMNLHVIYLVNSEKKYINIKPVTL